MRGFYKWERYLIFLLCSYENALLNRSGSNEAIHSYLFRLTKSMGTIHGLLINGWIPVAVVENNRISSSEINSQASSTSTQEEYEQFRAYGEMK